MLSWFESSIWVEVENSYWISRNPDAQVSEIIHIGEENVVQQNEIQKEQNTETNVDQNNIEIHLDPSQSENSFVCTLCEFKCA